MKPALRNLLLGALLTVVATAWSQRASSIYTCVDAKGRKLTSDRPIAECMDREQKELSSTGTVRRTHQPAPTALEKAAIEERDRKAAEEKQRVADERRAARALVTRYPNRAAHDAERAKALRAQQEVIATVHKRVEDLNEQRKQIALETEFYKDPGQWPSMLRRQFDDNTQQLAAQQRIITAQEEEKARINGRYDEELARLKTLWAQRSTAAAPAAPTTR